MSDSRPSLAAWISAAGLAAVTVLVFYTLRDYGPESAIRRFHTAAAASNSEGIDQVAVQDLRSDFTRALATKVYQLIAYSGAHYRIVGMDRQPNQVDAVVAYTVPDRKPLLLPWVIEQRDRVWRVNAERTLVAWQKVQKGPG